MKKFLASIFLSLMIGNCIWAEQAVNKQYKSSSKAKQAVTFNKENTDSLINAYQNNPTEANYNAIKKQLEIRYDNEISAKKANLVKLKKNAKNKSKAVEMQQAIDELVADKQNKINEVLNNLPYPELTTSIGKMGSYHKIEGLENVSIAYSPTTNAQYAKFIKETNKPAPINWKNGEIPEGQEDYPVTFVSYNAAIAYCNWLSKKDGGTYRLPTEKEWMLAAGRMPKKAEINSLSEGLSNVNKYSKTLSASGAIDMWGNVWEWTSTDKTKTLKLIKGGSWSSKKSECRTKNRAEGRNPKGTYNNVGFRVVKEN